MWTEKQEAELIKSFEEIALGNLKIEEIGQIVDGFREVMTTDTFHETIKIEARLEIALECVAFNDNLYELLGRAIALYQGDN